MLNINKVYIQFTVFVKIFSHVLIRMVMVTEWFI